jgi:hypothetical protein
MARKWKKMTVWCRENNIPKSTFQVWLYPERKHKKKKITPENPFAGRKNDTSESKIVLEWMGCKIFVNSQHVTEVLEKCLPIIRQFS